jgi:predicted phosphodiesterase
VSGLRPFCGMVRARVAVRLNKKLPAALVLGVLSILAALILPDRCHQNELGRHRAQPVGDITLGPAPRRAQAERFTAACGAPREVSQSSIRRAPYLQKVTASSAAVLWTADTLERPLVAYWPAGTPARASTAPAAIDASAEMPRGHQYQAELGQLASAAVICYEVRDGERALAGPFGFTTAPAPGVDRPIRIAAFGDMGYRSADQDAVLAQLEQVEFDFALLAGDIAYPDGRLRDYEENVFAVYARLMATAPFFVASGNHDYRTDDGGPFRQVFAMPENGGPEGRERWYSFDWGDLHVVVLDTERLGPAQEKWLEQDLTAAKGARWTIAMMHRAPFTSGERGAHAATRKSLVPVLARHKVPLVITGHEHHYERFEALEDVTYIITGGGGRGTRKVNQGRKGTAYVAQVAHFVYLEVGEDQIKLWAIDATGQTFDTSFIPRLDR